MLTVKADAGRAERRLGRVPWCARVVWVCWPGGGTLVSATSATGVGWCGWCLAERAVPAVGRRVLLPVLVLTRRADTAAVIGAALVAKAAGVGHRRIAVLLGRPAERVRGWKRGRVRPTRV